MDKLAPTNIALPGIPSAGRTVMSAVIADHFKTKILEDPDVQIVCMFSAINQVTRKPCLIFCSAFSDKSQSKARLSLQRSNICMRIISRRGRARVSARFKQSF